MKAFHVNCTKPFFLNDKNYHIKDYEILTTIISALKWREHNGKIKLYTDVTGLNYYEKKNMLSIWNEIDFHTLENHKFNINYSSFWAAGKIIALSNESEPCFMMDTDFIVWKNIKKFINNKNKIKVIHKEDIFPEVYIDKDFLKKNKDYSFKECWDWLELPCNTAFAYFGNIEFKNYYTKESLKFMHNNLEDAKERISQMVFAEQRLISMCAKEKNIEIDTFLNQNSLDSQDNFTHIWGFKNILNNNIVERTKFCVKLIKRIISDYPSHIPIIENIPELKKYMMYL